jgi:SAM-dependent methyltransferase
VISQHRDEEWAPFIERYQRGKWRGPIFRDMVLADASLRRRVTLLDIGCGRGFDHDLQLQNSLAQIAQSYIGVEPDPTIPLGPYFTEAHRCFFEDAPIAANSVDIAFAVMVLEHLRKPKLFWKRLREVLAPGGVFWGFTMDRRHWFCEMSLFAKRLGLKDAYLRALHGGPSDEGYETYPVYYRANTPAQILPFVTEFRERNLFNFRQVGQLNHYLPRRLRFLGRLADRLSLLCGWPGTLLAVRLVK